MHFCISNDHGIFKYVEFSRLYIPPVFHPPFITSGYDVQCSSLHVPSAPLHSVSQREILKQEVEMKFIISEPK